MEDDDYECNIEKEEKSVKRKFENIFDNSNAIIILNTDNKRLKNNSFQSIINNEDNEYNEDIEDEDYEKVHENIAKNKKYIDNNPNFHNYCDSEMEFFLKQSIRNKNKIIKYEKKTNEINNDEIPIRFKIINSDIDDIIKAVALKKLNYLSSMNERSGEYFKILSYVENLCKINSMA